MFSDSLHRLYAARRPIPPRARGGSETCELRDGFHQPVRAGRGSKKKGISLEPARRPTFLVADDVGSKTRRGVPLVRMSLLPIDLPLVGGSLLEQLAQPISAHGRDRIARDRSRTSGADPPTGTTCPSRAHQPSARYVLTSRPRPASTDFNAVRMSPARSPAPQESAIRPRRMRRARGKRSRKRPLDNSTDPRSRSVIQSPEPRRRIISSVVAWPPATSRFAPRGSGGSQA